MLIKVTTLAGIALLITACQTPKGNTYAQQNSTKNLADAPQPKSNNTLIVFYQTNKKAQVVQLFAQLDAEILYDYQTMSGFAIKVNPAKLDEIKTLLENDPNIYGVNYDNIMQLY